MKDKQNIIVIGGGVIGVSVAYYLAKQGSSVTLLEKNSIGSGASYGNAGLVSCENYIPMAAPGVVKDALVWMFDADSPFYIKPRLDLNLLRWLIQFNFACSKKQMLKTINIFKELKKEGDQLLSDLVNSHKIDCNLEKKGRLIVYKNGDNFKKGVETAEFLKKYGVEAQVLDQNEILIKEPNLKPTVVGGLYYSEYSHLAPDLFVKNLGKEIEKLGVKIKTECEVIGFETLDSSISKVNTSRGDYTPDHVILAAGAWSPMVVRELGLKVPIQPAKGYSITAKRPESSPIGPLSLADERVAVSPMGNRLRFSSTLELCGYDSSINLRRISNTRNAVNNYLKGMDDLQEIELWSGFRPNTPDTLPLIGRSGSFNNLVFATGHDVLGMTHSQVTGKLVSQIVFDEKPFTDISVFDPERFN